MSIWPMRNLLKPASTLAGQRTSSVPLIHRNSINPALLRAIRGRVPRKRGARRGDRDPDASRRVAVPQFVLRGGSSQFHDPLRAFHSGYRSGSHVRPATSGILQFPSNLCDLCLDEAIKPALPKWPLALTVRVVIQSVHGNSEDDAVDRAFRFPPKRAPLAVPRCRWLFSPSSRFRSPLGSPRGDAHFGQADTGGADSQKGNLQIWELTVPGLADPTQGRRPPLETAGAFS